MKNWAVVLSSALYLASCGSLPEYGDLNISGQTALPEAGNLISVTTWNIGYGALGADADFLSDGGSSVRALSRDDIQDAAIEIGRNVGAFGSQFILLQELSDAGYITRTVPVRAEIEKNLTAYSTIYWEDLGLSELSPWRVSHGMGVYGLRDISASQAYALPQEPGTILLDIKRYYAAIVTEGPIRNSDHKWILLNVHLSAFDDGGDIRRAQIKALFDFAVDQFNAGNHVVIGGDWNMRIADTDFAHTTSPDDLFWIHDFPPELLPAGWKFGVDRRTPTVRTLNKPYIAGDNFTAIIDGFVYSPNVHLREVKTADFGFEHTDHHPVTATFMAVH